MMRTQPKKIFRPIGFRDKETGFPRRYSYGQTITSKEPEVPKPLEYEDLDEAFNEFADKMVDLTDLDGKRIPTFTLYSNQRFSEYSQTWEHTDEDGNLLMNFKTVNRQGNPTVGSMNSGYWNIPGERRFTTHMKTVLDDDGREHVEIYSMKQPYAVDLTYRINFVTNTFEMLNRFNEKIHDLFKSRQCYMRPNGHFIPMVLEDVTDETTYSIDERKFFVQSVSIKAMAYIIHEDDFEVRKYAKKVRLEGESLKVRPVVSVEEDDDNLENRNINLIVDFPAGIPRVEFEFDTDMEITGVELDNVTEIRLFVNDNPFQVDNGVRLRPGDIVRIKIFSADYTSPSSITLYGYDPNVVYESDNANENVAEDTLREETIKVE